MQWVDISIRIFFGRRGVTNGDGLVTYAMCNREILSTASATKVVLNKRLPFKIVERLKQAIL